MNDLTPDNIKEVLNRKPFDIKIMNIDSEISKSNIPLITSSSIFEPNSTKFHPEGLFSEEIFGRVTEITRFTNEAAIKFHTKLIHPVVYTFVIEKKKLYTGILNGTRYAKFNSTDYKFELADENDKNASTGYAFFVKYLPKLVNAERPKSLRAGNIHDLLVKYKNNLFTTSMLVLPAGLRDIDVKSKRLAQDDINKVYLSIINLSAGLIDNELSEDMLFDGIRFQLQKKVAEISTRIQDITSGKKGFFQRHYGARKIAFTTRNVISVGVTNGNNPDDPTTIKSDETMVPLLQTMKNFQPLFINYIKNDLYGELFKRGSTETVPVTNPKTLGIEYVSLPPSEIKRVTNSASVADFINKFKYIGFRESPVSITGTDKKKYWLIVTYQDDGKVFLAKSKDELKELVEKYDIEFDINKLTPLTWAEAIYIASVNIVKDKHGFFTRYPVLGDGSIYPSKIHVVTTTPDKQVLVILDKGKEISMPHYPIKGGNYYESMILHPAKLSGLNADMDGDMLSNNGIWSEDGNAEIDDYLGKLENVIGPDMKLKVKADTDILQLTLRNISID